MEREPLDRFAVHVRLVVLGARDVRRLDPQLSLVLEELERSKRVSALERDRVIQDVQDTHHQQTPTYRPRIDSRSGMFTRSRTIWSSRDSRLT